MKSNKLKREPKYIAKFKAFPYQQEAVDAVKDLEYAAIFHEQGLGKTKIAIDVLLYWLSKCSMDTALIVTKKQLVANWVNEFKDHTSIKPAVLNTDKNNNYRIFCGPYRVVLTNFETLETEKQQFELYLKVRNVGIIIDESAKLKNPNSKLTKTYFELAPLFQRRIIMTGTPVANRPYDIWAQIYFLDFGESLGADFNEFKKETDLSNKLSRNTDLQEEFEDNISQIFNRISSFTVRETKNSGIITLPDVIYNELRKRGYRVDVGNIMIVEPGKNGKPVKKQLEVDFICSKGSKKYYIQSAYSLETEEKMAQEIRPFTKINDSFKKIVITSNTPKPFYNDDGILMMSVFDFLLKQESLEL